MFRFASSLFPSYRGEAVFGVVSAANHSCDPNCEVAFVGSNLALLVAVRSVRSGEELSIAYAATWHGVAARRRHLLRHYGFWCECARCVAATGWNACGKRITIRRCGREA